MPYAPLVDAFRTLIEQFLREPDAMLAAWREHLQEAVVPNGRVLTDLIHEVEYVLGPQPAVTELGPIEACNRLTLVFQAFVRTLALPEHPLVLFLDDLQWADPGSLQLVQQLLCDTEMGSLLLIGAYRETEVGPEHFLSVALKDLREVGVTIQEIRLDALALEEVTPLCAESLSCGPERARALAELILDKTAGNPFFVQRLLRSLVEDGLLQRDETRRAWNWDVHELARVGLTDNVLELLLKTIERLPAPARDILMIAACIGNCVNVSLLAAVHDHPLSTANHLRPALEAGLLVAHESSMRHSPGENREALPLPDQAYQFVHDRVQQAAYSLLPDSRKTALHLHIARALLQAGPVDELEDSLFDIVDQFNLGGSFIQDESERLQLAELNLRAGRKAKAAAAYRAALEYLTAGMNVLPPGAWERHGVLTFALHRDRAECAYLAGEHALADQLIEIALTHTPSRTAKAELYHIRIIAATVSGDYAWAIHWGREGLALFGLELPAEQVEAMVQDELSAVMGNLGTRRIDKLAAEAETRDADVLACMRLLSSLASPAFFSNQNLLAFILTRMVNLSLRHGPSKYSAFGYTFYAALHMQATGDYEAGYAFGRLGVDLSRRFGDPSQRCKAAQLFAIFVNHWKAPLRSSLPLYREAFRTCLESGEFEYAAYALIGIVMSVFALGDNLGEVLAEVDRGLAFAASHKNQIIVDMGAAYREVVRNLQGRTRALTTFDDDEFEEARYLQEAHANRTTLFLYDVLRLQSAYLFEDYDAAYRLSESARAHLSFAMGLILQGDYNFYTSLTLTARCANGSATDQQAWRQQIEANQAQLAVWAEHCPDNFRHKHQLVAAEVARLTEQPWQAMQLYSEAIDRARQQGFTQDEALANELAGRFFLTQNQDRIAGMYLKAACAGYRRWGAGAKAAMLERAHQELLASGPAAPVLSTIISPSQAFDTLALMKAAEAISGEIEFNRLLDTLLRTVLQAAGANRGVLLLEEGGTLMVRARATENNVLLEGIPVDHCPDVPPSVIDYVLRTENLLLLPDTRHHGKDHPDLRTSPARAILCLPIRTQAQLVGLLYLENCVMAHAFTEDRAEVVRLLSSQIAISLENARLYKQSQEARIRAEGIFNQAAAGIAECDLTGRFVLVNQRYCDIVGRPKDEVLHLRVEDITHPEDLPMDLMLFKQMVAGGPGFVVEKRYVRPDGSYVWVNLTASVIRDVEGKPQYTVAVCVDITERKRAEEALRRLNETLEAQVTERTTQLLVKQDQLRSLAAELSRTEERERQWLAAELHDHLAQMLALCNMKFGTVKADLKEGRSSKTMNDIQGFLDEALTYTRTLMSDLRPPLLGDEHDLSSAISWVMQKMQRHGLLVTLQDDGKLKVLDDEVLAVTYRSIQELLFNVLKHARSNQAMVSLQRAGEYLEAVVLDQGVGFDVAASRSPSKEGTFGLFNIRERLEPLGGRLELTSVLGGGTRAKVIVPLKAGTYPIHSLDQQRSPSPMETADGLDVSAQAVGTKIRILLVDDHRIMREGLRSIIEEQADLEVAGEAADGVIAVQATRGLRPDVVIMDVNMPKMNGLEATRQIKAEFPQMTVIGLSMHEDEKMAASMLEAGASAYVSKGRTFETLCATIRKTRAQECNF